MSDVKLPAIVDTSITALDQITQALGDPYGASQAAYSSYEAMIRRFSPREVAIMLDFPTGKTLLAERMRQHTTVATRYRRLVSLVDEKSVPRSHHRLYERWRRA